MFYYGANLPIGAKLNSGGIIFEGGGSGTNCHLSPNILVNFFFVELVKD